MENAVATDVRPEVQSQDEEAPASDARHERMDRVAVLFGEITAATREFLAALAKSDRHRDWEDEGFGSCAEWLAWRIGITRGTANEKVRAARALEDLPLISEAMARGELSFSKIRAVTRAATRENEAELLDFARAGSAANLERLVRGWKKLDRCDEAQQERIRHRRRCFSVFPDEDGMYVVRGRLSPEVGAALMRAVEAASDAFFAEGSRDPGEAPEPAQLRADAVGLVAERALAAGFADTAPVSGSRAERYQVVLHVEAATLREEGEPGRSELEDGTRVAAETARRLSCDASRVEVRHDADGSVLDVGRKTRTVPPALSARARRQRPRMPLSWLWAPLHGRPPHRALGRRRRDEAQELHLALQTPPQEGPRGGYQVCSDREGQVVFFTPQGNALFDVPPPPELLPDPVERLVRGNRERGITPDWSRGAPMWNRDRDIPWAIEAAALEAIDPWDEPSGHEPSVHPSSATAVSAGIA